MDAILPENTPQKQCTGECKQFLPATDSFFYKSKSGKYGVASICMACAKAQQTKYRIEHPEKVKENNKQYHLKHKEELNAYRRQYQLEHKDELNEVSRQYYLEHQEEQKENNRQYRQEHKDEKRVCNKQYALEHREELCVYNRHYRIEHIEELVDYQRHYQQSDEVRIQRRVNGQMRRARKKDAGGTHTVYQLQDQLERQKHRCYWCHDKLGNGKGAWHVDHVVPLSRGGSNDISNIVIACPTCNIRRNNKLPHEWPEGGRLL